MKKDFVGILFFVFAVLGQAASAAPNIVFIIADDLGFSDLGCYGGEAATPNLDRLAEQGVRFSQFYNCGKCEPTRAALMTGHRNTPEIGFYGERAQSFLPAVLKADGYRTMLSGKWHVAGHPMDRGFDRFFGMEEGACNYYTGSGRIKLDREPFEIPEGFYTTDAFTDYALKFLDEAKQRDDAQPFFLYLAYNAPHDPLQMHQEEVEKYHGKYMNGWHETKLRRLQNVRRLGLVPESTAKTDWPQNLPRWPSLSDRQKKAEDLRMATYTAMIDRMDQNIGRVFQWLEKNGERENTLIVFVSDNGANPFDRGSQQMAKKGIPPGGPDSRWSLGTAWAHVCNTPFRLYKRNQHEGGICAPMILCGPGVEYKSGSICSLPVHVLDFMPTFHSIAGGVGIPAGAEGTDLSNLWKTGAKNRNYEMMGYMIDHRYIRRNDWKLVSVDGQPWELFNLGTDRSETKDVITGYPEKADELKNAWEAWYAGFSDKRFEEQKGTGANGRMGDKGSGAQYHPVALK
ncbi:arylsulfatase [Tichowtungia aerotolerans]|uniref:Sulfatase-like hydrolase/transferase n=1 Tax=Tichowtungia aerotolerans TaxID=2697043 RepID=A0A6P1MBA2_9BACT|nr:arylsulfatase [Tichowtungia aerotolerans]QHI70383.1 sulfatase-like hydrolase/transferase [Tichowtungia aerotolerans]